MNITTPSVLYAVDPGVHQCGLAEFWEGRLQATGYLKTEELMHKKKRKRYCRRRKCALRIPIVGICLWTTTVRRKCPKKRKSR